MKYIFKEEKEFKYLDEGEGPVLLLLHGLFGSMSNFTELVDHFSKQYRVILPILPIYELSLRKANLGGLVEFTEKFINHLELSDINLLGNSLGGHIGILYTLKNNDKIKTITLTGSSGLFENSMGASFPKRSNYDFIKEKVAYTFYDPKHADKTLVDEVFEIVNNRNKALRVITTAKSAIRQNLSDKLDAIKQPVLLVWGNQDTITPPFVGKEFQDKLVNSELKYIDKCGHAPMMEVPEEFNTFLDEFMAKHN